MPVIRIEFTKEGNAKYISHLDLIRTIQRSVRRAEVPVEYSKGFNPHSKIAYGPALAVGISGGGEFMDMDLNVNMDEAELTERLNGCLPAGIKVTKAQYIPENAPSLTASIDAAEYRITGCLESPDTEFGQRLREFFERDSIFIERTDKRGRKKKVDIKPMIIKVLRALADNGGFILELILDTGSKSNLKPSDLISALERDTSTSLRDISIHRERLMIKRGDRYFSPMEVFE
jgi:radical SAM-linked protein